MIYRKICLVLSLGLMFISFQSSSSDVDGKESLLRSGKFVKVGDRYYMSDLSDGRMLKECDQITSIYVADLSKPNESREGENKYKLYLDCIKI